MKPDDSKYMFKHQFEFICSAFIHHNITFYPGLLMFLFLSHAEAIRFETVLLWMWTVCC